MNSDVNFQVATQFVRPTSPVTAAESAVNPSPDKTVAPEAKATPASGVVSKSELPQIVGELAELVQAVRRELEFSVDEESGRTVITVRDSETKSVIRQIPPEEVLTMIDRIRSSEGGLIQELA